MKSEKFNSKKTLLMGIYLLGYLIVLGFRGVFLMNAIYGWITENWAPLVASLAVFGICFTTGATAVAEAGATTLDVVMCALVIALWPWEWLIIGGCLAGVYIQVSELKCLSKNLKIFFFFWIYT